MSLRLYSRSQQPLNGFKVGVFTSVVGWGGSEVLVADAIEASILAGAEVVCWSHPKAAVRGIMEGRTTPQRPRFLDWPAGLGTASMKNLAADACSIERLNSRRSKWLGSFWRCAAPLSLRRLAGFKREVVSFRRELERESPDVLFVNVNGSEAASVAGGLWSKERTINCYHLSYTRSEGNWALQAGDGLARRLSGHAAGLTVHTSATVRDQWCRALSYPAARTQLIYNGVESVVYAGRGAKRAELAIPEGCFAFCIPGRLHPMKGHRVLLQALAMARREFSHCQVLICGDGELLTELTQQCHAAGLSHIVRFLGFRSDLPDVLHASDSTVLASVNSENLSVAVLESLAAGTPAIVTSVGGMAEAVLDGKTGYIVRPRDPTSLCAAMLQMIKHPANVLQMGHAARDDAKARFSRKRMLQDYSTLFEETIRSARPRSASERFRSSLIATIMESRV